MRKAAALALALTGCAGDGRYAAWVSFDLSLVALTAILAALIAAAFTALLARTRDRRHLALGWLIAFVATFVVLSFTIAALSDHRVVSVETVFPYP